MTEKSQIPVVQSVSLLKSMDKSRLMFFFDPRRSLPSTRSRRGGLCDLLLEPVHGRLGNLWVPSQVGSSLLRSPASARGRMIENTTSAINESAAIIENAAAQAVDDIPALQVEHPADRERPDEPADVSEHRMHRERRAAARWLGGARRSCRERRRIEPDDHPVDQHQAHGDGIRPGSEEPEKARTNRRRDHREAISAGGARTGLPPHCRARWPACRAGRGAVSVVVGDKIAPEAPVANATKPRNATPQPRSAFISSVWMQ